MPRKEVQQISKYVPPLEGRKNYVRLDFNENLLLTKEEVAVLMSDVDYSCVMRYPEYNSAASAIQKYYNVSKNQFILCNGVDEGIRLIVDTYISAGDRVAIPVPTFPMYQIQVERAGGQISYVPYRPGFKFPYEELTTVIQIAKMVFLCSPNNPTGQKMDMQYVRELASRFPHVLIVVDEAYSMEKLDTSLLIPDNILVMRTFSKHFGLAGLRCGMIFGNSLRTAEIRKVSAPYSVNGIVAEVIPAVLKSDLEPYLSIVVEGRSLLKREINKWGFRSYSSDANFVLVSFGCLNSYIVRFLKQKGILIRNLSSRNYLKNHSRITVGTPDQMQQFAAVLENAMRGPAVLFDLDGVLVDVRKSYWETIKKVIKYFTGSEITDGSILERKGIEGYNNDWDLTAAIISSMGGDADYDQVVQKFQEVYVGSEFDGLILEDQCIVDTSVLSEIHANYRMGIVTGRPRDEALFTLDRLDLLRFFDIIVAHEDVSEGKPSPEGILRCLKSLKAEGGFYVGDTINDILAAKRAGITAISVTPCRLADQTIGSVNDIGEVL